MKTSKLTLLNLLILALLVGGAFLTIPGASTTLIAEVPLIEPKPFDLENPDTVTVHVKLADPVTNNSIVDQIDPPTVLLEGFIPPTNTYVSKKSEFIAEFDGYTVAAWVISKITHLGITTPKPWVPIKIPLKITGQLNDGTPWEGTGDIKVYVPDPSLPPPPP